MRLEVARAVVPLPQAGSTVGAYEVLLPIGKGGMAAIYAVRRQDAAMDRVMAMKIMLPGLATDTKFVEMFRDEVSIAARVEHPNVVHVYDVGDHDGLPYLIMELLRGRAFSTVLKQARRSETTIPLGVRLSILAQAARGLHGAHKTTNNLGESLDVVHRDVTPHNIHVTYDGQVRLVDFGIAAAKGRLTQTGTSEIKGKFAYLAPEQIRRDAPIGPHTDLWALGVTIWETLCARRLFRGESNAATMWNVCNREVVSVQKYCPEASAELASMVASCLSRDISKRPESSEYVASVLAAASARLGGDQTRDIAATMDTMFGVERATEDERLASMLRAEPPPLSIEDTSSNDEVVGSVATTVAGPVSSMAGRDGRGRGAALVALCAILVAGVLGYVWRTSASDNDSQASNAITPPPAAEASREAPEYENEESAQEEPVAVTPPAEQASQVPLVPTAVVEPPAVAMAPIPAAMASASMMRRVRRPTMARPDPMSTPTPAAMSTDMTEAAFSDGWSPNPY
ncbi:MAG: protein kinase [Polyangiales bacterium]